MRCSEYDRQTTRTVLQLSDLPKTSSGTVERESFIDVLLDLRFLIFNLESSPEDNLVSCL